MRVKSKKAGRERLLSIGELQRFTTPEKKDDDVLRREFRQCCASLVRGTRDLYESGTRESHPAISYKYHLFEIHAPI